MRRRSAAAARVTCAASIVVALGTACTSAQPQGSAEPSTTIAELVTTSVAPAATRPAGPATTFVTPAFPSGCTAAQCPQTPLPGYEVAGVPAGWARTSRPFDGRSYQIQYREQVSNADPIASNEAEGRRITLIVTADPDGNASTLASGYPGHAARVAGVAATVVETAPPPGGRHGVVWRTGGLAFEIYAYMDEPELLRLASTVTPTGRPAG